MISEKRENPPERCTVLLKGGRIIDARQRVMKSCDVRIENGKIVEIGEGLKGKGENITGCYIFPSFVDLHTHIREPGMAYKERLATTLQAAAKGGYGSIVTMANTDPVIDTPERVDWVKEKTMPYPVEVLPLGAVTEGLKGKKLSEMLLMKEKGVAGFSDDGKGIQSASILRKAMSCAATLKLPIFSHCEDSSLSQDGVINEGTISRKLGLRGIPPVAETAQAVRDILLSQETGCRLHLCHVSCAETIFCVRWAKKKGIPVTCEVTPHHLLFSDTLLETFDSRLKVNPPLRSTEDVLALRQAVLEGLVDAIATDHAPHSDEEKEQPIQQAPFGIASIEIAFSLMFSLFVAQHMKGVAPIDPVSSDTRLSLFELLDLFSTGPAKVAGIDSPVIAQGEIASLVIFDPKARWKVADQWISECKLHPYESFELQGKVVKTILNGKIAYE